MTFSAPDFEQFDRSILISVSDTGIFLRLPGTFRGFFRGVSRPSDVVRPVKTVDT